jgi:phosphopantothenoylcysteine decarboxylase / phosphopantothenate---cysteine ligase
MTTKKPEIVLGVTGSIAAYKAADLLRRMVKADWGVSVVMTAAATKFVAPLTFQTLSQRKVTTASFAPVETWMPEHIALADRADLLVIAPCTANTLAKIAQGLANDSLSDTVLACRAPKVIAPAMNDGMWANPATQANLATVRARGITVIDVDSGDLACGRVGEGRMADVEAIFMTLREMLK